MRNGILFGTMPIWATLIVIGYAMRGIVLGLFEGMARGAFEAVDVLDRYRK